MKYTKRLANILLTLVILVSCTNQNNEIELKEPTRTADLIDNINDYEKAKNQEQEAEELDNQVELALEDEEAKKENPTKAEENATVEEEKEEIKSARTEKVRIKVFGDIMAHEMQNIYAYNRGGGVYDYTDSFAYIKDYVSNADIAIGNYETTTNPNLAYAGYPRFNTPKAFIDAIAGAGFDILTTANNHSLDTEVEGLYTTIEAIEEAGLSHVGSMRDESEKILLKNVNDVNIAFLAYTYGANGRVNLLEPREEVAELNYLNDEKIQNDIRKAKAQGADFVVVYPHWGIEYQSYPNERQTQLARDMIEWGADLVIGNHPHVVQPYEWYEASDGRTGFIAYALGNLISYQNLETTKDIRTEQGVSYDITLSKNFRDGSTSIDSVEAYPLWVGVRYNDYGASIQTRLAIDFLEAGKYQNEIDDYQRNRVQQAYDMTTDTIKQEVSY